MSRNAKERHVLRRVPSLQKYPADGSFAGSGQPSSPSLAEWGFA